MASKIVVAAVAACAVALAALAALVFALRSSSAADAATLQSELAAMRSELAVLAAEVTRFRIEQRAEGRGPQALLEKIAVYAPYASDSRVAEPDFKMAKGEMDAVMRAFGTLGKDGYQAVLARIETRDPKQDVDELRQLLRAAVACDRERGLKLVADVLRGQVKPNARLRSIAAFQLLQEDMPLARQILKTILLTESSRGLDPDLAVAHNVQVLDPAATATSDFCKFVTFYLRSEDPDAEATLLQVLSRAGQDVPTLQEAIEELGRRKSRRAEKRIEELYRHPPVASDNPLFLNKCIDALVAIRGPDAAKAWLEDELVKATNPLVQKQISWHLGELSGNKTRTAQTGK